MQNLRLNAQLIQDEDKASLALFSDFVLKNPDTTPDAQLHRETIIDSCLQILAFSKSPAFKELRAASNAMTILNALRFSFSGLDLREIKVRGVLAEGGLFASTDLSGACLDSCQLARSVLTGCNLTSANVQCINLGKTCPDLIGHSNVVSDIVLSPDEQLVVSGSWDKKLKIWNRLSGAELASLAGHSSEVRVVALSQDGKFLASGGADCLLIVWDFPR